MARLGASNSAMLPSVILLGVGAVFALQLIDTAQTLSSWN
jgi:hypothetical protein